MPKEVSMLELIQEGKKYYKVTFRIPELEVSETRLFASLQAAQSQIES